MENLVDFEELLTEELKNPEAKKMFEIEKEKMKLELKINEILRQTGNGKYCVSLIEEENY